MRIVLTDLPLDPWAELARHQVSHGAAATYGASCVFVGTLRDFNQGESVRAMTLEHYAPMTQRHLERVVGEAAARWPIGDVLLMHRHGALQPGDPIVCVAVWAAHRDPAFQACRYIIDELKTRAPFWKLETTSRGRRWVAPES